MIIGLCVAVVSVVATKMSQFVWRAWQDDKSSRWGDYYECLFCGMHILDPDAHKKRCVLTQSFYFAKCVWFISYNPIKCAKALWRDKGFSNAGDK